MNTATHTAGRARYEKCIEVSKRIRWDIDRDVIRDRRFDFDRKFLPDGLSLAASLEFLDARERRLLSQVQGRTYANMFGLVERFISAKMAELTSEHALGDQAAFEALVRFTDEELKHQALFRRIEELTAQGMPPGYRFLPQANEVANAVLAASTWAVLALTCHIELFTQVHYRESIAADDELSPLYKDVFFFHWKEESQHAIVDELEWRREDARLTPAARASAVDDLIGLVAAVDGLLQMQAPADAEYFASMCGRAFAREEKDAIVAAVLRAYRWQFIVSGVKEPRFSALLSNMAGADAMKRIGIALAPLLQAAPATPSA
jgi:hypothetical protein